MNNIEDEGAGGALFPFAAPLQEMGGSDDLAVSGRDKSCRGRRICPIYCSPIFFSQRPASCERDQNSATVLAGLGDGKQKY